MRRALLLVGFMAVCVGGCGRPVPPAAAATTVRIVLTGDVSLGRDIAATVEADPASVFEGVRYVLRNADLALGNLESPFTTRPLSLDTPFDLRADPASAQVLAAAGFDVMGIANNHAGDAGPATVLETYAALAAAGLSSVGGGDSEEEANAPYLATINDLVIAVVAVDATGFGPAAAASSPGVATVDDDLEGLVRRLSETADLVVVGVHGGAEYLFTPDAEMSDLADALSDWGADVVWGHGAHVVQPVIADQRGHIVATSLGNFLFEPSLPGTDAGAILEVMAGPEGVVAYRLGRTAIERNRVAFTGWDLPEGDAALVDGEWWALVGEQAPAGSPFRSPDDFRHGDVVAADIGDVDGDGTDELVASFRRPYAPADLHDLLPGVRWSDARGRSAHVGVFDVDDLSPEWVASAVARPVVALNACDGALAVAYSELDDPAVTGLGGWTWNGFGWAEAPDLPGAGRTGCRDVDGDGRTDPVAVERS